MAIETKKGRNIPNILTFIRLLSIFPILFLLFNGRINLFILLFILVSLTDFFDGFFARKYDAITQLGQKFDPIADKVVISCTLFGIYFFCNTNDIKLLPLFVPVVIAVRDIFLISGFLILKKIRPHIELGPTRLGKLTTFLQFIMIFAIFFIGSYGRKIWIILTLFFTIVSGVDYFFRGARKVI